ncbi:LysM peptidoglycan-binding domain-containing protein [Cytobacillus massiliigabonensis]|uniref:LysM peptidoglycan-binding domain-containing protein n=1 Tax=Cytobacillus massiliigabonensis TaxID=1871011 RepID=UPI000C82D73A|nr:LysM peptidoglycan-binding domain-containing protein [Cytobacillus massiliigabonensis]
MNREDPYRDQAERLRKKIEKNIDSNEIEPVKEKLPPRSRHHQKKKKKNKWKIKYPVISLLALFFILLPIAVLSIYHSLNDGSSGSAEKASTTNSGFETVGYENKVDKKVNETEVKQDAGKTKDDTAKNSNQAESKSSIPTPRDPVNGDKNDKGVTETSKEAENKANQEKQKEKEEQEQDKDAAVIYHTVKSNETLYRIAMNYYKSQSGIEIIRQANNLNGNEIRVGQVLKIPKK